MAGLAQQPRGVLGRGDGQGVDDAAARQVADVAEEPGQAGRGIRQAQHAQAQRLPGERPPDRDHRAGAGAELLLHVVDHALVRGRRGRQHRHAGRHAGDQVAQAPVVGSEVVAPVRDAVRLVDDQQPDAGHERGQLLVAELRVVQPLGADEQHVDLVVARGGSRMSVHSSGFAELMLAARTPARSAAATWSRIRASSGETRIVGPAPRRRSSRVATKYTADLPHPVRWTTRARARRSHERLDRLELAVVESGVRVVDEAPKRLEGLVAQVFGRSIGFAHPATVHAADAGRQRALARPPRPGGVRIAGPRGRRARGRRRATPVGARRAGGTARRTGLVESPTAISTDATTTIGSQIHVGSRSRSRPDSRNGYSTNEWSM